MDTGRVETPPRNFLELRDLLVSRKDELAPRLAQVAAFAMANPDEIAFGTVASIADRALVQPSTLVRFSQAFGYHGFSELQTVFRDRLRDRLATYEDRLRSLRSHTDESSRPAILFEGFRAAARRSIDALEERVDADRIEMAARRLARADTIYLIGQRRSYPVTAYMSYAFGKLGVKTVLIGSPAGIDAETLSFATVADAAIAVSFTPYAATTLTYARQVAALGIPLIVMTDSVFSPLAAESVAWFEVVEADYEGFRCLSAAMVVAMTLTVAVAEARHSDLAVE